MHRCVLFLGVIVVAVQPIMSGDEIGFRADSGKLVISAGDQEIATYVYQDEKIPRPYFAHVKALDGRQVTRNHPPIKGKDRDDHATMHPGIWLAFGDLNGSDFWRNRANVVHKSFIEKPAANGSSGKFVEQKEYLSNRGLRICSERFHCQFHVKDNGYLLLWDSTFTSDREFYFGDQEEMGLGMRVTSPVAELSGGQLTDSKARRGASKIWSNAADWCDYSGVVGDRRLGMTLLCHPKNFRPSWFHARNYGFVAANAFGRKAMGKGGTSRITVKPGESLRLRYGIWIYSTAASESLPAKSAYDSYVKISK